MKTPARILRKAKLGSLVQFTWWDAVTECGWQDQWALHELIKDGNSMFVSTVGWLVRCDKDWVSVSNSIGPDGSMNGHMTVPLRWVEFARVVEKSD